MAFSFGNSGNAMLGSAAGAGGLNTGPDLETIQTEALGFLSIAGDAKVRLTSSWTSPPSSTSSLLSIASRKGLVAAAGPDQVILATTVSVRKAFESPRDGDSDVRGFEPQLKLPMPMRVSQLCFTADEKYLILSAESGGGLAVYEVQSLLQGSTNSAFELSTNGESLRALIPNPVPEKAELCAIVTDSGNLHMANLKDRQLSNPLKNQISCISWSSKGKQLCVGLADGSIQQMTPEGEAKGDIPKPPNVGDSHVSSLTWLENNLWLSIHTSNNQSPPASVYNIITRQSPTSFSFQKVTDPVDPFGSDKVPHHSILRLRDFPPALQDLLILSSTASSDIGVLSRSKTALATDKPADAITGVFTTTEFLDDTRRPTLPMTDSMDDSIPIGIALDLSGTDKVYKPIPSDVELEESPVPLPGCWVLTHEGVLCSWWVVYNDSIKQGTAYPGLTSADTSSATTSAAVASPALSAAAAPSFGSSTPTAPAFGSSAQLGQKSSPWATAGSATTSSNTNTGGTTFGQSSFGAKPATSAPAFGQPSSIGSFGQSAQIGARSSPWGSAPASGAGAGTGATPSFGQSGFSSFASKPSPFTGSTTNTAFSTAPASGGFSAFSGSSAFVSVANNNNKSGSSIFGGGNKASPSPLASSNADTAFPSPQHNVQSSSPFGSTPFKLQSAFKADASTKDDNEKVTGKFGSGGLFGNAFGSALTEAANKPAVQEEDMDSMEATEATPQPKTQSSLFPPAQSSPGSTTPTSTPAAKPFASTSSFPAPAPGLFARPSENKPQESENPFAKASDAKDGGLFSSQQSTPRAGGSLFSSRPPNPFSNAFQPKATETRPDPKFPNGRVEDLEEDAPIAPDTTSRQAYPLGESTSSSSTSNATNNPFGVSKATPKSDTTTLAADNISTPQTAKRTITPSNQAPDAPLPPDFTRLSKPKEGSKGVENVPLPSGSSKPAQPIARSVLSVPLPSDLASAPLSSDSTAPKAASKEPFFPSVPLSAETDSDLESDDEGEEEDDDSEDHGSEGSGIDVAKDLSPSVSGLTPTPGFTPQSSFGGLGTTPASIQAGQDGPGPRPLFGEIRGNAPVIPRPNQTSPRSPSPVRGAIPNRVLRNDALRSVSAPGMASQILGPKQSHSPFGKSNISKDRAHPAEDPFVAQQRKLKARQEAEETQPLVDEEDDEVQRILASEIEGSLVLDEFIAHSNVAPPAKESVPSQVEALYRDINSMIDTLGLNARTVKSFIKGHTENAREDGRGIDDLEDPEDWVLCEIDDLGDVLDNELYTDLDDGRVREQEDKLDKIQEIARDMHRIRAKQEDLKKMLTVRLDPDQADATRSLPLSAEQAAQQNELRREFANFSKLVAAAEEALTLLKARIASVSSASGRGNSNVPTVEAVMRTINKMTTMVEKRSGDVDVLENQLRKVRLESTSREGSPYTPQARRSMIFSPDSTPSRNLRQSFSGSVMSLGASMRATPPRKKLSGFSKEEKGDLMDKRARRQAVMEKLKTSVEKRGANVWNMEDIE